MTIYEHAMIGVNGALAFGLQRRHGWQLVAWAGIAALIPDLDGLTICLGPSLYAEGHRLWGHNLLVAAGAAAILAIVVYCGDGLSMLQRWLAKRWTAFATGPIATPNRCGMELGLWIVVGVLAAYSHLLLDFFYSGGRHYGTWGVSFLWPFSRTEWAYPSAPWGDVGATLILAASMFTMFRWRSRAQPIAAGSLVAVVCYIAICRVCYHGTW